MAHDDNFHIVGGATLIPFSSWDNKFIYEGVWTQTL